MSELLAFHEALAFDALGLLAMLIIAWRGTR